MKKINVDIVLLDSDAIYNKPTSFLSCPHRHVIIFICCDVYYLKYLSVTLQVNYSAHSMPEKHENA